ncbi:MAG: nucleoside deaminase [Sphingomonadales bacterium]|nr:nucleoside deaminase [Sphingomonadales bacterium]
MLNPFDDAHWMRQALQQALAAQDAGEVPVGAIVVMGHRVLGMGHNLTERLHDVTAHAEMQAITAAFHDLGSKYLTEATLYVTLEPCVMCAGALYWSQIGRVVWGANDPKRGFSRVGPLLHPKTCFEGGLMAKESANLLQAFFRSKRGR